MIEERRNMLSQDDIVAENENFLRRSDQPSSHLLFSPIP
jgi:hypothetical protein